MATQILLAVLCFLIGSAPWWIYNFSHDWEAFKFLFGGFQGAGGATVGIADKALGFVILGLPAVIGVRFPWMPTPWLSSIGVIVFFCTYGVILIASAIYVIRQRENLILLWLMLIAFTGIFILSGFGVDATGRYLLPLVVPLAILVAAQSLRLPRVLSVIVILALLGVNLLGTVIAIQNNPPGLTPQFDPSTDFPNDADQAVIDFLLQHGGQYGYATYWAAYRLDFLSGERVILSPLLPYKEPFTYGGPDRYPAYTDRVNVADRPVLVTANLPDLDQRIAQQLAQKQITFEQKTIGKFNVFYNLSAHITPQELNLQN